MSDCGWKANAGLPPVIERPVRPAPRERKGLRVLVTAGLVSLGLAMAAVLFFFDPVRTAFYPRCEFYQITGWHCPGCGALRALHQLLHGHVGEALRLNPPVLITLAVLCWLAARWCLRAIFGRGLPTVRVRRAWVAAGLAALALYGVLRNLPFEPFTALKP